MPPTLPQPFSANRPLQLVFYAWLFGAFWMNIAGGAAMTCFMRSIGASDAAFGLVAAIPYLGAVVQLPVGYLVERTGYRKKFFLTGGMLERGMWMVIATIPWVLPQGFWWRAFLGCYVVAVIGSNTVGPCWTSWMADLLPKQIRGRFFSARSRLGQFMTVLLPLPVGWLLDHCEPMGDYWVRLATSGMLALAGAVGLVDIFMHMPVRDPVKPRAAALPSFGSMMLQPLRDRNFRIFLWYYAVLIFSLALLNQYLWLFCFDVLQLSKLKTSLLLIIFPTCLSIFLMPIFGPLIDRLGRKPLMMIGTLLLLPAALGWLFMSPGHWLPAYLLAMLAGAGWSATEMGRFNVLLSIGETEGGRSGSGIAYVAIFGVVCAVSGALSGCFASVIVSVLGADWRTSLGGFTITYHGVLFLISTAMRLLSILLLVRFHEPRAFATRDAIQYVAAGTVANLQFAVSLPFRFLRRLGATTFRILPPW